MSGAQDVTAEIVKRLAVVAYPTLSDSDRRWIESLRARHDRQASRIASHVTLAFPAEVAEEALLADVRTALRSCLPISIVLRRAAAFLDPIGGGAYVCVLPEGGSVELRTVHDVLYRGVLAAHRRREIPFVPHVTVGTHPELSECERLADQLNAEDRTVAGTIDNLDVIEVGRSTVRTVARIAIPARGDR